MSVHTAPPPIVSLIVEDEVEFDCECSECECECECELVVRIGQRNFGSPYDPELLPGSKVVLLDGAVRTLCEWRYVEPGSANKFPGALMWRDNDGAWCHLEAIYRVKHAVTEEAF